MSAHVCIMRVEYKKPVRFGMKKGWSQSRILECSYLSSNNPVPKGTKGLTFGVSYIGIIILIYPQSQKLEVTCSTAINLRLGSGPGALQRLYAASLTNTVTKSYQHLYG